MSANKFSVLSEPSNKENVCAVDGQEIIVHVLEEKECTEKDKRKCNPNMNSKGKRSQHKRYFKQGYRKRKRKPTLNFDIGESVVFESNSGEVGKTSVYVGRIKERDDETYIVESDASEGRVHSISHQDNPRLVSNLIVGAADLQKGKTVLVAWQIVDGFVQLVAAQIVERVGDDYVWVKSAKGDCVKVHIDNVVKTTKGSQVLQRDIEDTHVSLEEVNVIQLMLHATQTQLNAVNITYQNTLNQLQTKVSDCDVLEQQKVKLQELYDQALNTTVEYRSKLMESTITTQALHSLKDIITKQAQDLDEMSARVIALEEELQNVREQYQNQSKEIDELKRQNSELRANQNEMYTMKANASPGSTVQGKKIGNKTRPATFLPIAVPCHDKPSSKASRQTLKRRGELISEVLNVVSARQNPTSADIIQTLAAFLRRNPDIAIPACKAAKIDFATELDAKDAVDLKVLLRLPMTRMRDLRRFLGKFGVNILPSDKRLYKEMSGRQYLSQKVEVGVLQLKKTTNSTESPVAFFRINNLEDYIITHIERQMDLGNTVSNDNFNNELWIKIGGDKGGTTTKLAFQFVNQKSSNCAAATNIISMFEAYDSYVNMENVFGNFYDQVATIQRKETLRIHGTEYPVRIFYFGDTEYLCKTLGHMGPSSSYPCLWCKIQLKDLRHPNGEPHCPMTLNSENMWVPNEKWAAKRTREEYQQDLANLLADNDADNTRICGKDHHSISKRPLLPLPSDLLQIVPPSLHILLGLVVRYFRLMENKCQELDQVDVQDGVENLDRLWQLKSEQAKNAELQMEEAKEALQDEQSILQNIQSAANGRSSVKGLVEKECCMPLCKLKYCAPNEVKGKDIEWIQCVECGEVGSKTKGWYHTFCVGISNAESTDNDDFCCPVCNGDISGPEDVINLQHDKVKIHKALVQESVDEYNRKKKVLDKIYSEVVDGRGEFVKNLNKKLENIGVRRQAYHSQCFVGNHCKLILTHAEEFIDLLPNSEFQKNIGGLFKRMRAIFKLFRAGFLNANEVIALRMRCWELGTWFPKKFPKETIPPKFHMLVCHVPEFVLKWKTIGLLSEHGLESLHKDINSMERIYCTVQNIPERMRLIVGNHQQRSTTNVTSVAVLPKDKKTCFMFDTTGCKGRYKLAYKGATERVCKQCGHVLNI